jgi:hypothetical protein
MLTVLCVFVSLFLLSILCFAVDVDCFVCVRELIPAVYPLLCS